MRSGAELSGEPIPVYRYFLYRAWDERPPMLFIGLNPSTADAVNDDHTIRRCVFYAQREGSGELWMANLYALRATKPSALRAVADPVGPENDEHLRRAIEGAGKIVCCWGSYIGPDPLRIAAVNELLAGREALTFGYTKHGQPKHPSRLANDVELVPYRVDAARVTSQLRNSEDAPRTAAADVADVCATCGHTRRCHYAGGTCLHYLPARPLKGVDYRLGPVELATELQFASKARGHALDPTSSVCACARFEPSGLRVAPEADPKEALAVREGRKRRTVLPIAELVP